MEQAKTSDCFNQLYRAAVIFNNVFLLLLGVLAVCVSLSLLGHTWIVRSSRIVSVTYFHVFTVPSNVCFRL